MLRATAAEAERILQDAVGKLDDPLHLRCTSSPGRAPACPPSVPTPHPERAGLAAGASAQAPPLTWPLRLADYLVSRAQAALDAVSALEKGHAQYLASRAGECHGLGQGRGLWCPLAIAACGLPLQGATPWSPPCGPGVPQTLVWFLLCGFVVVGPGPAPPPPYSLGAGLLGPFGLTSRGGSTRPCSEAAALGCVLPEQTPPASWWP